MADSSSGEQILRRIFGSYLSISGRDNQVAVAAEAGVHFRFRPPFKRTCKHDARCDGINLVVENMVERGAPLWVAHLVARRFVQENAQLHNLARFTFDENKYEPINAADWCKDVVACFEEFAKKYARNEYPLPTKPVEWDQFRFSLYFYKNRKSKMEDRHLVLPSLAVIDPSAEEKLKNDALFAVFDGHNGTDCAAYAASHLTECFLELVSEDYDKNSVLNDIFSLLDKRMTLRCEKEHLKSGTTACCAYISQHIAYLAWCGDSSIGLLRPKEVVTLTKRHSPSLPEEAQRIESVGGSVYVIDGEARVNGVLNVSRSLGDLDGRPMVSQDPDLLTYSLNSETDYIMYLSSDGIWDTLYEENIFKFTREFISTRPSSDSDKLAEYLGQKALADGATDNLTMVVVYLKKPDNVWAKVKENMQAIESKIKTAL